MSASATPTDRFYELANATCNGLLTDEEREELAGLVVDSPLMRQELIDFCRLHTALNLEIKAKRYGVTIEKRIDAVEDESVAPREPASTGEEDEVSPTTSRRQRGWRSISGPALQRSWSAFYGVVSEYIVLSALVSALFLTIILLSMALIVPDWKRFVPGNEPKSPSVEFVARIADAFGATFDETSDGNFENRDLFEDDTLVLDAGLVVVTYDTGARVVLEGPAIYQIQGANGGDLRVGKLVARVDTPEAKGFAIDIPGARVVDLGTEFGVEVQADGAANVAVLSGEVNVVSASNVDEPGPKVRLLKGQGAFVASGSARITRIKQVDAQLLATLRVRLATIEDVPDDVELIGQLGILDLRANGGINPATRRQWKSGDKYRLIFATSMERDATSKDIEDYNAFVQSAADASELGLGSVKWKALASTEAVDAIDNTSTNAAVDGPGESFWLVDGTSLVADNYADLYGVDTHSNTITISETGGATPTTPNNWGHTWTGSDGAGVRTAADALGAEDGTSMIGLREHTSGAHWIARFGETPQTVEYSLYGVSEVLTVAPRTTSESSDETRGDAP